MGENENAEEEGLSTESKYKEDVEDVGKGVVPLTSACSTCQREKV
jgi:hypothetical protein